MLTLQDFKADLFRVLANPARIRILETLRSAGSLTVGEIQQRVGIEPANASQHLSTLRTRGIVEARREGTSVWYSVAETDVFLLLDAARSIFEHRLAGQAEMLQEPPGRS
jgi:ArsR family transcriptional regulator